MRIVVTYDDYAYGEPSSPYFCPVALAIQRRLGYPVAVSSYYVDMGVDVTFPDRVSEFIRKVDDHKEVALPFIFNLDIPA